MLKQKSKIPKTIQRVLILLALPMVLVGCVVALFAVKQNAQAATNATMNFQARLLTAAGNVVPDGSYNVEFKIYKASTSSGSSQGSCTGDSNCVWTETRTSSDKVTVRNGYLTVNLGSVTAFGGSINWDQEMWLTMNIGGTGAASWDGEMNPRLKLTSVPYAFRSGAVVSSDGTGVLIAANGESGTICVRNSVNCGFVQGQATDFIQNQSASPQAANLYIQSASSGSIGTIIQAASGQTADIFQVRNSLGNPLFQIGPGTTAGFNTNLTIQGQGTSTALTVKGSGAANNSDLLLDLQNQTGASVVWVNNGGSLVVGNAAGRDGRVSISNGTYYGGIRSLNITADRTYDLPDDHGVVCLQNKVACGFILNDVNFDGTMRTLTLGGSALIDFTTPGGSNVKTKINIPYFDPGASGQVIALGVPSSTNDTARALSLFDARAGAHQPTISVFSPDESDVFGLSWDGQDQTGYLKNTAANIAIRLGTTDAATFSASSVNLQQNTTIAAAKSLTVTSGATNLTGEATGDALTVSNSTSTGNVALFKDNSTAVLTLADGGAATFQNSTDSSSAFRVLTQGGTALLTVNTSATNTGVYIAGTGTGGGGGRVYFGPTGDTGVWIGEEGTTNTNMLSLNGNNGLNLLVNNSAMMTLSNASGVNLTLPSLNQAFNIDNSLGNNVFTVDTNNTRVGIGLGSSNTPTLGGAGLEILGALRLSGDNSPGFQDNYTTPKGTTVKSKINIVNFNPTSFGQLVAMGLGSGADGTTRALSLFDQRAGAHQPTLAVISPDEGHIFGLSWDGSDTTGYLKSAGTSIGIRSDTTDIATFSSTAVSLLQDTSIASGKTLNVAGGATTLTGAATGDALTVSNSTSTGNIAVFKDNGTAVLTLADGGAATFQNSVDSTSAFRILRSSGSGGLPLFTVDTTNSRVSIGNGSATGALLVLDSSASDPTGTAGAMYYSTATSGFRCYTTQWTDCAPLVARKTAAQSSVSNTHANVTNMSYTVLANSDYRYTCHVIYSATNSNTGIELAVASTVAGTFSYRGDITSTAGTPGVSVTGSSITSGGVIAGGGVGTTGANYIAIVEGIYKNGATGGTMQLTFARNAAGTGTVTIQPGSACELRQL
jgi:hypothetical protein